MQVHARTHARTQASTDAHMPIHPALLWQNMENFCNCSFCGAPMKSKLGTGFFLQERTKLLAVGKTRIFKGRFIPLKQLRALLLSE